MVGSANPSTKTQIERLCNGNKKVIRISASAKEFAAGSDRAESEIRRVTEAVLTAIKIVPAPEAVIVETALHGEVMDLRKEDERYSYEPGTSSRMINTGLATVTELVLDAVGQEKIAGLIVVYLSDGNTLKEPTVFRVDGNKKNDLITEDEKAVAIWAMENLSLIHI